MLHKWHTIIYLITLLLSFVSAGQTTDTLDDEKKPLVYIRKIIIQSHDPFGYDLNKPERQPSTLEEIGNRLHLKTKDFKIRNSLLFKEKEPLDSLKMMESERLIRKNRYIRNSRIVVEPTSYKDSVDVYVKTLDAWSLYTDGSISENHIRTKLTTHNFGGWGHFVQFQFFRRFHENQNSYTFQYSIPNIYNTYINSSLSYHKGLDGAVSKSVGLSKPFYSPITKWAGGAIVSQLQTNEQIGFYQENRFAVDYFPLNYYYESVWYGRAIPIKEEPHKITNLIFSGRIYNQHYKQKAPEKVDPTDYYSNQTVGLLSASLSSYYYKKDRYIFFDDLPEDIAIGKKITATLGYRYKNDTSQPYAGIDVSLGKYFGKSYLGLTVEAGSYFKNYKPYQTTYKWKGLYFSKAYEWGQWRFRQFITSEVVVGSHRDPYEKDRVSLHNDFSRNGFEWYYLRGKQRYILTFQTQSYSKKQLWGFRFNPYINFSVGKINKSNLYIDQSPIYTRLGVGVQINNDYFVFTRIQLSFSYFPITPEGSKQMQFNSLRNNHIELQQFHIGAPQTVIYQ